MVDPKHTNLSVNEQCKLLGIHRSGFYYKVMGIRAMMPGRHTSRRCKSHVIYPYLLRNLKVALPNQVWVSDITYIPVEKGYMYLVAIIDSYSRYVVG